MALRRYWTHYGLAWVPLCGVYTVLFVAQERIPVWYALLVALGNVLPDALFGVVVARDAQKSGASAAGVMRGRAFRSVVGLLLVVLSVAVKAGCNMLSFRIWYPEMEPKRYSLEVLGWQCFFTLTVFLVIHATTRSLWTEARLRDEAARRSAAEASRARAELAALRSRLDPHLPVQYAPFAAVAGAAQARRGGGRDRAARRPAAPCRAHRRGRPRRRAAR
jgi:hypothetical protein